MDEDLNCNIILSPNPNPLASVVVRSKAVVLLVLFHCYLFAPTVVGVYVFSSCFVVQ